MKKVMIFGTFDRLHLGHLDFFSQAKNHGDYLIVVVARDANVKKIKGHNPDENENVRLREAQAINIVNKAVLGYKFNRYKIIKELRPDIICLGYDQRVEITELQEQLKKLNVQPQILRLQSFHPEIYKSSIIRNQNAKSTTDRNQ